jgi:hypothetical protein
MSHPYEEFEADPLWQVVEDAVRDLVTNGDVCEQTSRAYIVGYFSEKHPESGEPIISRKGSLVA